MTVILLPRLPRRPGTRTLRALLDESAITDSAWGPRTDHGPATSDAYAELDRFTEYADALRRELAATRRALAAAKRRKS